MTGRADRTRDIRRRALQGVALVTALALPATLAAQQGGGVLLTFGLDTRLESHTNADLDPGGGDSSTDLTSRLSFGYLSETRASRLEFGASAGLRRSFGGDAGSNAEGSDGLIDPDLQLSYLREAASAQFEASAFLNETDLARDTTLDNFDGTAGTRREAGADLALRWGTDAPVGLAVNASFIASDFRDGAAEPDRRSLSLGADLRLDLSGVASLTFGLSRTRFDAANEAARDTTAFDATLGLDRPRGGLTFGVSVEDTPEGTRSSLSFGRDIELPDGSLGIDLDLTRDSTGETGVTGSLSYARELPRGQISVELSREIASSGEDDTERRITSASLGFSRTLTPRATLSLNLGLAESRATGNGAGDGTAGDALTRNGNADLTVSYDLAQDWQMDVGLSHTSRDTETEGTARDTSVFLGLSRRFEVRY